MSSGIARANPVSAVAHTGTVEHLGSEATGTASAAQEFTDFLANEDGGNAPDPQSRPARRANAERRAREAEGDGADENGYGQGRERQPKRERSEARQDRSDDADPLHDPILDGAPEGDAEADEGDGDADDEGEGDDPDADDEGEGEGEGDDDEGDDDPEHEITINGVPTKVKLSELQASYSREADYRQKTEALSRDYEQVQEFGQALNQRRQQVDTLIQTYQDLINSVMPSQEEWDTLERTNPQQFIAAQKQWQGFIGKMEEAKAHRESLTGQMTEEQTANYNRYVKEENDKLYGRIPALKNPKVQKQFADAVFSYGKKMGYTPEEMARGLVNHRDVLTAYYASRYLQIQESRQANKKQQARKGPRQSESNSSPRSVQTPRGQQSAKRMNRQQRADRELQRTGSIQSAGEAFANMFRD
jgi:hypothetical protein